VSADAAAATQRHPRKIGRPRALTAKAAARIIAALKKGIPFRFAAAAGGISANTLLGYRNSESPTYDAAFAARCEEAREQGLLRLYERVNRSPDWRAAWRQLEYEESGSFVRRTIVAGDRDNPVRVEIEASLEASAHIRSSRELLMKLVNELAIDAAPTALATSPRTMESASG
jgi:hypothetical protein